MTLYDAVTSVGAGRRRRGALASLTVALVLVLGLGAGLRAEEAQTALRDLPQLACRLLVPLGWTEGASASGGAARFRDPARGLAAEVSALSPRRDLADVEERLTASARGAGLEPSEPTRALTIDHRPARRLLFQGEILGTPVRQLVVLVDAPLRTYIVMIGAQAESFDQALADRVAASLERTAGAESEPARIRRGCAACDKEYPESQKFCGECGAKTGELK